MRDTSARTSSQNIMHTSLKASKLSIFPCCLPRHGVRLLGKHVSAGAAPACRDVRWSWRPCKRRYGASSPPHQAPNIQTSSSSPSPWLTKHHHRDDPFASKQAVNRLHPHHLLTNSFSYSLADRFLPRRRAAAFASCVLHCASPSPRPPPPALAAYSHCLRCARCLFPQPDRPEWTSAHQCTLKYGW